MVLLELLGYAEEMNHKDTKGATALHEAIAVDHTDLINRILNTDADVNALDRKANTPLNLALKDGNLEIARLLLNHHAINLKPPNRRKVLGYYEIGIERAASRGGDDILQANFETMMEQWGGFAVPVGNSTRRWGKVVRQTLESAARHWHESVIKLILGLWRKFGLEKQYPEIIRKIVS
ncbi:hypothetical protein N7G274_006154 [Stereocaulon virgatum]|uniref:Ankyrin repeat domain-containing protein 54 n=1 Tax=Stereocaulon virgatum TaxID=373712 RepID=A0ABR4A8Y6_9LECA